VKPTISEKQREVEIDGKPVRDCFGQGMRVRTHPQTDGHVENVIPSPPPRRRQINVQNDLVMNMF